jgi:beta-lactam-binding protein with PASTA domain
MGGWIMPTMPNVINLEYEDALNAMIVAGIRVLPFKYFQEDPVSITWIKSNKQGSIVLDQVPTSGSVIPSNAIVNLTVSNYPTGVVYNAVPNLGMLPYADFMQADISVVII